MELPILIQPSPDGTSYTASLGAPFNLTAAGATADEAERRLVASLQETIKQGAELRTLSVPGVLSATAGGWLPDDDLTREWLEQVRQYRQECHEADTRRLETEDSKAAS